MRKTTAIATLFILFITIAGYQLLFLLERAEAKSEIMSSISKNFNRHTDTIVLNNGNSLNGMLWENDHEFSLNGRMYDVVRKEFHGNKLLIICLADDRETALIDNFIKLSTQRGNENKPVSSLWKLLNVPFLLSSTTTFSLFISINNNYFNRASSAAQTRFPNIQVPPPRVNA